MSCFCLTFEIYFLQQPSKKKQKISVDPLVRKAFETKIEEKRKIKEQQLSEEPQLKGNHMIDR